jgi:hypothetical protein
MKAELKEAMEAAEMDATMLVGQAAATITLDYSDALTLAAFRAIQRSERTDHPTDQYKAKLACEAWMEANEAQAMTVIAARKAKRDAYKAELARPKTAAEIDKMLGM